MLAVIDSGSSITAARQDICSSIEPECAGDGHVTCIHGSHSGIEPAKYHAYITMGQKTGRILVYELGKIVDAEGSGAGAMLGRNVLEGHCVTLDRLRMRGSLGA
ncbi:MAG: hypothetical protein OXU37_06530 [Thaumarchaeota archaeon]|nr:hypothetical protein [Nitrososphaerota archaeon]